MTDIQFLINLIINHNLSEEAKKLCLERIGEIEKRTIAQPTQQIQSVRAPQVVLADAPPPPQVTRSVTPTEVTTGAGTRGPRKF